MRIERMGTRRLNDAVKVLESTRKIIETPDGWTKGADGRNTEGGYIEPCDIRAKRRSLSGALQYGVAETTPNFSSLTQYNVGWDAFSDTLGLLACVVKDSILKAVKAHYGVLDATFANDYLDVLNDYNNADGTNHKDVLLVIDDALELANNRINEIQGG